MLALQEAEVLLVAWGAFLREEIESEVGYPQVSPSCAGYESPTWSREGRVSISRTDIERACWAMIVLSSRNRVLHRQALEHYRDGARLSWRKVDAIRHAFARLWVEWARVDAPLNSY